MDHKCEYGVSDEKGKLKECGLKAIESYKFEDGSIIHVCEKHLNQILTDTSIQYMNDIYSE